MPKPTVIHSHKTWSPESGASTGTERGSQDEAVRAAQRDISRYFRASFVLHLNKALDLIFGMNKKQWQKMRHLLLITCFLYNLSLDKIYLSTFK